MFTTALFPSVSGYVVELRKDELKGYKVDAPSRLMRLAPFSVVAVGVAAALSTAIFTGALLIRVAPTRKDQAEFGP